MISNFQADLVLPFDGIPDKEYLISPKVPGYPPTVCLVSEPLPDDTCRLTPMLDSEKRFFVHRSHVEQVLAQSKGVFHFSLNKEFSFHETVVFDIDGTLASTKGLTKFSPEELDAFNRGSLTFPVNAVTCGTNPTVEQALRDAYAAGYVVILATARNALYYADTIRWLHRHNLPFHLLYMNHSRNTVWDSSIKVDMFRHINQHYGLKPVAFYEDSLENATAIQRLGVPTYLVREGSPSLLGKTGSLSQLDNVLDSFG